MSLKTVFQQIQGWAKLKLEQSSGFSPDPSDARAQSLANIAIDSNQQMKTRGQVLSDEGSFRDDYSGSALTTSIGTIQFINGSPTITGTGFLTSLNTQLYVKKTADSETLYLRVTSVDSDTSATLESNYAGTTANVAAVSSRWKTVTGSGGSFAVANSVLSINSGTTNGAATNIQTAGDYLPYTLRFYASISQRIANQTAFMGFMDAITGTQKQAIVQFTGTTNTTVSFITSSSSAASDTQTTAVTIPVGAVTSSFNLYQIDISANQAALSINGIVVATHSFHIPGPYDSLAIVSGISNSAAVTTTALNIDLCYFSNWDRLQIDNDFSGEPIAVIANNTDRAASGNLTAAGQSVAVSTSGSSTSIFSITGTWVATLNFEASVDGGSNWFSVYSTAINFSFQPLSLTTSNGQYVIVSGGFSNLRVRCSAYTSGTVIVAVNTATGQQNSSARLLDGTGNVITSTQLAASNFWLNVNSARNDGIKTSYSFSITGLVAAATPTDILAIVGSATKTVRITRLEVTATQTTAAIRDILLIKRSAANTGGTSTVQTLVPHDSNNAAATCSVLAYTANPTALGAAVGQVRAKKIAINTATAAVTVDQAIWEFGTRPAQAIVLRGVAQVLSINLNGVSSTGSLFDINGEITEE
jgi:hypothetical protein